MIDIFQGEVQPADAEQAARLMAELVVWTWDDPRPTHEKRLQIASSYILTNLCEFDGDDLDLEHALFNGLVTAGSDVEAAAQFAADALELENIREMIGLDYFTEDLEPYGIRINSRHKWIEPKKFVGSILKLGKN